MRLGIDFGTCLSSAAFVRDGVLTYAKEPVRNGYSFPSSAYLMPTMELLLGQAAENQRLADPQRFRAEFKRTLGSRMPCILGGYAYQPEALCAAMLQKLKREAELAFGRPEAFDGVVLTIPADYQEYKRGLMAQAAATSGFRQVELLEEPVAAALAYSRHAGTPIAEGTLILVYDLGGGTFDAALLRKAGPGFVSVATPQGLPNCGGVDFDRAIYEHFRSQHPDIRALTEPPQEDLETMRTRMVAFTPEQQALETMRTREIFAEFCKELKHQLSAATVAERPLVLPGMLQHKVLRLDRATFAALIEPYLQETIKLCHDVLGGAGVRLEQIGGVLLVGGSCRLPAVQEAVATRLGRPVWQIDDPELAVCQGAALWALTLDGPPRRTPVPSKPVHPTPPPFGSLVNAQMAGVSSLVFPRDGNHLLTGDLRGHLWLWEMKTRQIVREFASSGPGQPYGGGGGVCALAFDASQQQVVAGYQDAVIRLWDYKTGRLGAQLPGHGALVRAVAATSKGDLLVSGGDDRALLVWNLRRRERLGMLMPGHSDAVTTVALGADNTTLLSGSKDRTVRMWDLQKGKLERIVSWHTNTVRSVALSPDGRIAASAGDDGMIFLWDVRTGQLRHRLAGHERAVNRIAFRPGGALLVSGGSDRLIKLWRVADGTEVGSWQTNHGQWVRTVIFSPDGGLVLSGGEDHAVQIWAPFD